MSAASIQVRPYLPRGVCRLRGVLAAACRGWREARRWAASHACIRELQVLESLGHCPHDEAPERVNPILLHWLAEIAEEAGEQATGASTGD